MSGIPMERDAKQPSMALYDPEDQEQTQLTRIARLAVEDAIDRDAPHDAYPVQFVRIQSGETVILEAHGQASFTGHGKQGLRPGRLALLRQLNETYPVLLVFVEGYTSRREAWLSELGEAVPISLGDDAIPGSKRYGWSVQQMSKMTGRFELPRFVPTVPERPQGALL